MTNYDLDLWLFNFEQLQRMSCQVIKLCNTLRYNTFKAFVQGGQKTDNFWKYVTPVYDDTERRSIYQNDDLFITSKMDILNVIFKYSLHNFSRSKSAYCILSVKYSFH